MYTAGIRAGSRWPFTFMIPTPPDFTNCNLQPYPFFMGYATTYLAKHTGADVTLRDSIALRESYDRYYAYLRQEKFEYIVIESASPSWEHDLKVITELVINHTSDAHPWFQAARRAPAGSPERDFYVWSDTSDKYREARIIFQDFEPSNWTCPSW